MFGNVGRGARGAGRQAGTSLLTAAALIAASTALSGVFVGAGWLAYIALSTGVVAVIGIGLRSLHAPPGVTVLGQLAGLLVLCVALFTDLGSLLRAATTEIHEEVAPVAADPPLLAFCVVLLGLAAIVLDVLVVTLRAPAAAGLVLASVYAVPALLSDVVLPWWSFAAGAGGFAALLATSGVRRESREWQASPGRARGIGLMAITAAGVVAALLVAGAATPIGTVNRFSGPASGPGTAASPKEIGLRPMTRLRGMLDENHRPVTLFKVRGLHGHEEYLRALTLSHYSAGVGWTRPTRQAAGVALTGHPVLPSPGTGVSGHTRRITIDPVAWDDYWLPVFGVPRKIQHAGGHYRYNPTTGVIYSRHRRHPPAYAESAVLQQPTAEQLRNAGQDFSGVPPEYLDLPPISPRIGKLTRRITASAHTELGRAKAIWEYFTDGSNGFSYSLSTAPKTSSNALVDFVFHGKRGFCEQYATAMAVMLRTIGIPSRVAIGFTPGTSAGPAATGTRTITSSDAHAWVEVFFPGYGWQTFDPTPLTDGRGSTPRYLSATPDVTAGGTSQAQPDVGQPSPQTQGLPGNVSHGRESTDPAPATATGSPFPVWQTVLAVVLTALLCAACAPALVRAGRRGARLRTLRRGGPGAALAAWRELADSATDRGGGDCQYETLRGAARRWVTAHSLDEQGAAGLRMIVEELERSTYGTGGEAPAPTRELSVALGQARRSFARNAPLRCRDRWLPRSVLPRRRTVRGAAEREEREPVG